MGAKTPNEIGYYFDWGSIMPAVGGVDGHLDKEMDISGNSQYDAAAYYWKSSWKMPTKENWRELIAFCTQKGVNIGGRVFAEFTGPSGKSILIPLAGIDFIKIHMLKRSTNMENIGLPKANIIVTMSGFSKDLHQ